MLRRRKSACRGKRLLSKRGNASKNLFVPKLAFLRFLSCMHPLDSGHRSAALAVAEAFERLVQEGDARIPANTRIEVLDILDYGRVPLDGDKAASMFTGPTCPIYDITWRFTFTGRLLWGGGTSWARVMFKKLTDYVEQRKPIAVCLHAHNRRECRGGGANADQAEISHRLRSHRLRDRRAVAS